MSYQAGSAYVDVLPDMTGFQSKVQENLSGLDALFAKAGESAGAAFADSFTAKLRESLASLPTAEVKADADTTELDTELDAAAKGRTATITPEEDKAAVSAVGSDFDWMARDRKPTFTPNADTDAATVKLDGLAKDRTATVKADADTTAATTQLTELQRKIDVLKAQKAGIKVSLDATALDVSIAKAEAELDALTKKNYTVTIKEKLDSVNDKLPGTLPTLAGIGAVGLAPDVAALAAGLAGLGVGFAAAGADAGAFGAIAKPMFTDVTTAQKALTTAQAAYAKADTSKQRAAALQAEAAATAKLTPAEKDLLTQLTALEGAWKKLSQAEQPAVEQAIAPWLQTASDGMKLLKPLITDGGNAIELLGNEADSAIKSPFWTTFSTTLGQTGEIALQSFGEAVGKVGDGLAHLFVTFAPDIDNVLPLVDKLAGAFDDWAKSVSSKGLDDFLTKTFSPANVKALAADGKDLATFVENIAKASGELSPAGFTGLGNVLDLMGHLTPDEILALTGLFLAIKGISAASSAINGISSFLGTAKSAAGKVTGLFGGAETTAESATEGTAAGEAGGTAAATAFTSTFSSEVTAALPEIFAAIGTEGGTEAGTAGTAWGTAAATAFGTAFGAEDAAGITAAMTAVGTAGATEAGTAGTAWGAAAATAFGVAFGAEDAVGITAGITAVGVEGATEAGVAGAAMGSAMAAAFTAAFDTEGVAEIGASLGTAGIGATVAAGLIGAALGAALGLGFKVALAATGIGGAVTTIENDVKTAGSSANTWLQPAGVAAADGFASGFTSQAAKVQAAAAQAKAWTQAGAAGSSSWIQPHGQQAGQGFATGFASEHNVINSGAAQIKNWVTSALPSPASWLVNAGVSAVQGFLNGLVSEAGAVENEAVNIANSVSNTISNALKINSPSKVMIPIGSAVPEGVALGMSNGAGFITDAGQGLAKTTVAAMSGLATAQSLSALGVPSIAGPGRLPGVNAPLGTGAAQLQVSWAGTSDQVTNAIVGGLQFHIQATTGGDVQAAIGQGPVRVQ